MESTPIFISIEANIGAGKSTVLEKLQQILDPKYTICLQEPIEEWNNFYDPKTNKTILEEYYQNPKQHAFSLQTMIYSSLKHKLEHAQKQVQSSTHATPTVVLSERSLQSSSNVFTKMLHEQQIISDIEYQIYRKCIATSQIPLHMCIYLCTTPQICLERIHTRNRKSEAPISIEYLQHCHETHEKWIQTLKHNGDTIIHIIEADNKTPDQIVGVILEYIMDLMCI